MAQMNSANALLRNPITGIADCCPRAASGHAAAPPSQRDELAPLQLIELHRLLREPGWVGGYRIGGRL